MGASDFFPGEQVTIGPPYADLPLILSFRRHVNVARPAERGEIVARTCPQGELREVVWVELDAVTPGNRIHPVPARQVLHGWRDTAGRWL